MAINATTAPREITPAGNHIARCFQMIEIGTVEETIQGDTKRLKKCLIGWEIPGELNSYGEVHTITQEYTLSMGEKSNLRKMLTSWRGRDFTPEQAKAFDITVLINKPCMLNVIHKTGKTSGNPYATISSVTTLPKGINCPDQINKTSLLQYDSFDSAVFEQLPEFLRKKIESSEEYEKMYKMETAVPNASNGLSAESEPSDLPF